MLSNIPISLLDIKTAKAVNGIFTVQSAEEAEVMDAATPYPSSMSREALSGLAGDVVATILPHTEADEGALLGSLLAGFGNIIGRSAHFEVSGTPHYLNLYTAIVGATGKGRKGTSWGYLEKLFRYVDDVWTDTKVVGGLSSGEGLIWAIRDEIRKMVDRDGKQTEVVEVEGVDDKRILAQEGEFGQVMQVIKREGNTLSPTLRSAWDGKEVLQSLTKTAKAKSTGAYISIIAHVTKEELTKQFGDVEMFNGLGNRFIWLCVRRSKYLPDGGDLPEEELKRLAERLADAVCFAKSIGRMRRDEAAAEAWRKVYPALSDSKEGLAGVACGRAEAQVLRLSCIYALLDLSDVVKLKHLKAALAFWEYAEASARFIFGGSLGDPIADSILNFLKSGERTQTEISRELFKGNRSAKEIKSALERLSAMGKVTQRIAATTGRSKILWKLTN